MMHVLLLTPVAVLAAPGARLRPGRKRHRGRTHIHGLTCGVQAWISSVQSQIELIGRGSRVSFASREPTRTRGV